MGSHELSRGGRAVTLLGLSAPARLAIAALAAALLWGAAFWALS